MRQGVTVGPELVSAPVVPVDKRVPYRAPPIAPKPRPAAGENPRRVFSGLLRAVLAGFHTDGVVEH